MREVGLDGLVAPLEGVVLAVADRGGVFLVVAQVMPGQRVGESFKLEDGFGFGQVGDGRFDHLPEVVRFVAWFETLA